MVVVVVLLLCWPFVCDPPLDLRDTYFHLFGAWSAAIVLSWWLSRGIVDAQQSSDARERR